MSDPVRILRIAVLECDTLLPEAQSKYGRYCNVYNDFLKSGIKLYKEQYPSLQAPRLEISAYDVFEAQEYPDVEAVDVILISGSKFNAFDSSPWILRLTSFTQSILQSQSGGTSSIKLIGICFGHQIIARALSLPVSRSPLGWEVSVTSMQLTRIGQHVLSTRKESIDIQQQHRDVIFVDHLPRGVVNLATTKHTDLQVLYSQDKFITVQGHPEFTAQIEGEKLRRNLELGTMDQKVFDDGMMRVERENDGVWFAMTFIRFALGEISPFEDQ